ncbi:hypothetical protein BJX68DRAFT_249971 [Aspergillus pseudodeflectus]|uniref:Uncharacterized protein n=1 Tax=Aspergillus pseudodeflectus TaxID=176178 RepID=A0ABR4JBT9_9EURO
MEPVTADSSLICPLESQRSVRGLILKLFVVNFVTLCFYFHCYHQRQGRYLTLDAIVFFIAPLNTVFRYGAALLIIVGYWCYGMASSLRVKNGQRYRRQTLSNSSRALSSLLSRQRIPRSHSSLLDNAPHASTAERLATRIGPVIPALGYIVQCCGAIYLYNRRCRWNGVTMIDEQIFQLAGGGLLLGIISAGYTLRLPYFNEPIPDTRETWLEHAVHFLRDQSDDEEVLRDEPALVRRLLYLLKSLAFAFIVQLLLRNPVFINSFFDLVGPLWWFWVLLLGFGAAMMAYAERAPKQLRDPARSNGTVRSFVVFCAGFLYLALGIILAAGTTGALGWHLLFYVRLGLQAKGLKNELLDAPCPLLMADPEAEYIWWLA